MNGGFLPHNNGPPPPSMDLVVARKVGCHILRPSCYCFPNQNRLQALWIDMMFWAVASALCKLSIIWQYRRLFQVAWMRRTCNWLMIATALWGITLFFLDVFNCIPISLSWKRGVNEGCLNRSIVQFVVCPCCPGSNFTTSFVGTDILTAVCV